MIFNRCAHVPSPGRIGAVQPAHLRGSETRATLIAPVTKTASCRRGRRTRRRRVHRTASARAMRRSRLIHGGSTRGGRRRSARDLRRRRRGPTDGSSASRIWSSRCRRRTRCRPMARMSFRIFVIPLPVDGHALRARPGVPARQSARSCTTPTSASIDTPRRASSMTQDPAPGYDGLIAHSAAYPDGHFLGWTPGQVAPLLPKGLAWRLDPGTDLVVELHMQPSGKPESGAAVDRASISATEPPSGRRRCCGSAGRASTFPPGRRTTRSPIRSCCRWTSKCRPSSRTRTTARARSAASPRCRMARPGR